VQYEPSQRRAGKGWARLASSFRCAFAGCAQAWRSQPNVRIHMGFVVGITALAGYLRLPAAHCAILALTIVVVLVAELCNSALEVLTDLASPGYHPLARQAKDIAAGAVLAAAAGAVVVGLLILGPPLWARIAELAH